METGKLREVRLTLPATPEAIAALRPGDVAYLTGVVYTAREGVYERILKQGGKLPEGLAVSIWDASRGWSERRWAAKAGSLLVATAFATLTWLAAVLKLAGYGTDY